MVELSILDIKIAVRGHTLARKRQKLMIDDQN